MNYGLIIEKPKDEDYVFGGQNLGDIPINPSGNWSEFLPDNEVQTNDSHFETYACVSFATTNVVEFLEKQEFGARQNWSDRFLATISGTMAFKGNTPQMVAETLRKKGCVEEKDYPFDSTINTYEKFYAPIPQNLQTLALQFPLEYDFGHEYVPANADAMKEALKYSPLLFTTYAWVQDENGYYYRPQGMTDNHATVCYGYEDGKYWKIFDSYLANGIVLKKVRWDTLPAQCKRFTLHRNVKVESYWQKFLSWSRAYLGL